MLRRSLALAMLSCATALAVVAPSAAVAHTPGADTPVTSAPAPVVTAASDRGLFGNSDPTYDGVLRQAYAILGLHAVSADVPTSAITWLVDQQCPNGSFAAYRVDTIAACPPSDPAAYTGPDTNSTALAALALHTVGRTAEANRAMRWLSDEQQRGGGWVWIPGGTPDASSTGLVLAAVQALRPAGHTRIATDARNFLRRAEASCTADIDARFGMPFQRGLVPDTFSSSQSLLGLSAAVPVREKTQRRATPVVECRADGLPVNPGLGVAKWISRSLNANDGALPNTYDPDTIDWNSTALSILGLIALRTSGIATDKAVAALQSNIESYIGSKDGDRPAALGISLMIAAAKDEDPRDFGGANLIRRLLDSRQG